MLIIFDSKTGNTKRFIQKLDMNCIQLSSEMVIEEPFILITYTTGFGQVPVKTQQFLSNNYKYLKAVCSSGNKNWGDNYGKSADIISLKYNVPVLLKFELSGTNSDVRNFKEKVMELCDISN